MTRILANDDLLAGLPQLPPDEPWSPAAPPDEAEPVDPQEVMLTSSEDHARALTQELAELASDPEKEAALMARLAAHHRLRAVVESLRAQQRLAAMLPTMKPDQAMAYWKLTSTAGNLMPKEEKANVSPFSLTIVMPDGASTTISTDGATPPPGSQEVIELPTFRAAPPTENDNGLPLP